MAHAEFRPRFRLLGYALAGTLIAAAPVGFGNAPDTGLFGAPAASARNGGDDGGNDGGPGGHHGSEDDHGGHHGHDDDGHRSGDDDGHRHGGRIGHYDDDDDDRSHDRRGFGRKAAWTGMTNARVARVEATATGIEVVYTNGVKEEIENGVYEMKDASGRTVVERAATADDVARLSRSR